MRNHRVGDRVVVCSFISCGRCWSCQNGLYSCCDNGNTNPGITEELWGAAPGGVYGYSHALGGFAGSHAEYVRVPYDQAKQQPRLQTDRPTAVRQSIYSCRKGGSVFVLGVFGGVVDRFPLGAMMNKGLTVRGAQQHGHRYIPMILERMTRDEIVTEHLATRVLPLAEGPRGYDLFKNKKDGNVRSVFVPGG